jgi:uncharacterized membrane protein YfcA
MLNKDDLLVSLRRTLVPMIVGLVAGSFLAGYVNPDALDEVVTGAVTAVYYLIVRLLESKIPVFGVLLGSRKQPVYLDPK